MRAATRGLARDALHLAVLSALAIAQPLFDLLGKYPAFFAAHDTSRSEVVAFGLVLVLVPPLLLALIELLTGLASPVARRRVHLVFIGALAALLFLQVIRRLDGLGTGLMFALAALLGAAAAVAYSRVEGLRSFLSILGPAPIVFLLLFLLVSPTSKIVVSGAGKAFSAASSFRPPIVFITFDAFAGNAIETPEGKIDAKRYPHLARLAKDGAWYRNASNVHENTVFSVPSILDGKLPKKGQQPIVADHPNNLFTLLGKTYDMNVAEEATNLCPPGLCSKTNRKGFGARMREFTDDVWIVYEYLSLPPSYRDNLPQITDTWAGFRNAGAGTGQTRKKGPGYVLRHLREGRVGRFRRALRKISQPRNKPQLNFMHVFFPHEPRQYLPDGKEYQAGANPDPSLEGPPSYNNDFLTRQGWQRELLQVGFTDRLVGEMVGRLRRLGLYDQAMIVIVADHGESFDVSPKPAPPFVPGKLGFRRAATKHNLEDIATVPLFVKYPKGHGPKGADDRYVRDIDILPTIADVLGIRLPFRVDGRSLLDKSYRGHGEILEERTFGDPVKMDVQTWQARRKDSIRKRIALFGQGDDQPGLFGAGPRRDLLGKQVSSLAVSDGSAKATFLEPERFEDVDTEADFSPSYVAGRISGGQPGQDLALAVNGKIVSTGQSFNDLGPSKLNWAILFPHSKLRNGRNRVELFQVTGTGLVRLASVP
jgi:hypothetical protein